MSKPQALLFDFGGVLADIDFTRALRAWAPHSRMSFEELKTRFRFDEHYERHERGEIDARAYFDHLASALQLTASPEEIERGWNSIFVGEITQTRLLLQAACTTWPCYALTNTNASHMACWIAAFPEIAGAFVQIFASHEIGLRKPDRAAFEYVCRATGIAASSILFFDDLAENVAAASAAGLKAVLVRSPDDVATSLQEIGDKL